jgi:hypothetical protein
LNADGVFGFDEDTVGFIVGVDGECVDLYAFLADVEEGVVADILQKGELLFEVHLGLVEDVAFLEC